MAPLCGCVYIHPQLDRPVQILSCLMINESVFIRRLTGEKGVCVCVGGGDEA